MNEARNTAMYAGDYYVLVVKEDATIYAGTLVAIDADGYAIPAAKAEGLTAAGRAEKTAFGGETLEVRRGAFGWDNSATDPVERADIGQPCYIEDDCTISSLATSSSVAGKVLGFDYAGRVLVETK